MINNIYNLQISMNLTVPLHVYYPYQPKEEWVPNRFVHLRRNIKTEYLVSLSFGILLKREN
jgi:hypothetical protein